MYVNAHRKNTLRNLFKIFGHQGNLLHFEDMLPNLHFTLHKMPFIP